MYVSLHCQIIALLLSGFSANFFGDSRQEFNSKADLLSQADLLSEILQTPTRNHIFRFKKDFVLKGLCSVLPAICIVL